LITVSPSILQWYADNVGPKDAILVLNSPEGDGRAGEVSPASNDGSYLRRTFDISDEDPIFIYVGLFIRGRGIEQSIEAFSGGGVAAHLVFLGYGSLRPLIESAAKTYPRIHYHPPVKHDKVVGIVRGADVGLCLIEKVSLSDYFCLPNKLFEYSFAGVAVLGSDLPDIRAAIEKYELGAVTECSSDAIREAVSGFVDGRFRRGTSCLRGLTWEAQAKRLVSAYDSL
jgi:glycosyltransferase involved in cell wall biosynthesis